MEDAVEKLADEYMSYAEMVAEKGHDNPQVVLEAHIILQAGREGVVKALRQLAKMYGGCVSCRYSMPAWPNSLSLTARFCRLGLRQDNCGAWEPLLK